MKRWIHLWILICIMIVVLFTCVYILSLGLQLSQITVWSKVIIFVGQGLGTVVFTPYLWFVVLVIIFLFNHEKVIGLGRKLSLVFESLGAVKFRAPNPEEPISADKIQDTIQTSKVDGRPRREDTIFFKELLTKNGSVAICRFLLYSIDRPGRPSNFSLHDLVEWTFGKTATDFLEIKGHLHSLAYPASLLVQIGALEGKLNISGNLVTFESTLVSPSAHQAIEELCREGFQMTPQVEIK